MFNIQNLAKKRKKELGVYYTPIEIAKSITEETIDNYLLNELNAIYPNNFSSIKSTLDSENSSVLSQIDRIIESIKILDGATGDGKFLQSALLYLAKIREKIAKKLKQNKIPLEVIKQSIVEKNLYGMEIDKDSVKKCHLNLLKCISKSDKTMIEAELRKSIIQGNFLQSTISDWRTISSSNKFDIILGNPPWGGKLLKEEKKKYSEKFGLKGSKRNLNIFELFLYQASSLLNPTKGMLAFLLPKNVTRSNQYIFLRKFILNNYQILSINFYGLFEHVTQEFISLIGLYKSSLPKNHMISVDKKNLIPQSIYKKNIDYIFIREYEIKSQELIENIHKESFQLDKFIKIRRGEELSKRGGVMFCNYCLTWVPLSSRKESVECPRCSCKLMKDKLKLKFIIKRNSNSTYSQPILTGDDFEAFTITSVHFIDPTINYKFKKDSLIYKSPKLVVQKIKSFPCSAFDSNDYWTTQNVYSLVLKSEYENKTDLLFYIMAILNSKLIKWYYEKQFNLGSKYTNAISIRNLKRLPIKQPSYDDKYKKIVKIAQEITKKENLNKVSSFSELLNKLIFELNDCESYEDFINLQLLESNKSS